MHAPRQCNSSGDGLPRRSCGSPAANSAGFIPHPSSLILHPFPCSGGSRAFGRERRGTQRLPAGMWRLLAPSRRSRAVRRCRNPLSIGRFGPTCRLRVRRIALCRKDVGRFCDVFVAPPGCPIASKGQHSDVLSDQVSAAASEPFADRHHNGEFGTKVMLRRFGR